jgi:SAM-dependent methyltransferase
MRRVRRRDSGRNADHEGHWRDCEGLRVWLQARCDSYAAQFAGRYPDSVPIVSPTGRWLQGVWMPGQNYRGTGYYGAYPPHYLGRLQALFTDVPMREWLHLFAGSLTEDTPGVRVERRPPGEGVARATIQGDAEHLPFRDRSFRLIAADPPYTPGDALRYKVPHPNKVTVLHECHRVLQPGGFLVWLDTSLPMYAGSMFHHWGMIFIQRSTNHRVRLCSLFTRMG